MQTRTELGRYLNLHTRTCLALQIRTNYLASIGWIWAHASLARVPPPSLNRKRHCICNHQGMSSTSISCVFSHTDSATPPDRQEATIPREIAVGISMPKYSAIIFDPINPRTIPTAGSKYFISEAAFERIVYRLRNPIIANIFEVKTIRGFWMNATQWKMR